MPALTPVAPDSVIAYRKHGVYPTKLRYVMNNLFYFPDKYASCLHRYYILQWQTEEFLARLIEGTIKHDGIRYQVIYHNTDPTRMRRKQAYTTVKLSFREADAIFNIIPTVLVLECKD